MTLVMNTCVKRTISSVLVSLSLMVGFASFALADGPAIPAGTGGSNTTASAGAAGGSAPQQQPSGPMQFIPLILMFGVIYFLVLRPQQKKMKEQQEMLSSLKHGDEILTSSGILGKVTGITDKVVTVEVADNVRVKMMKSQVSQVIKGSVKDIAQ